MPRAQALSEILLQNFRSLQSPLAFSPFLKTSAVKQHTPSTRRNGKDLVTGRTCSTTAQNILTISLTTLLAISHTLLFPPLSPLLYSVSTILTVLLFRASACLFLLLPHVGFSSNLPPRTQCRFVPLHRPSHHFLPPSLNQLHQPS